MKITQFKNQHWFLALGTPCEVFYDGTDYPSVSHAYNAASTKDLTRRENIRYAKDGREADQLGKDLRERQLVRPDWKKIQLDVLFDLVKQKFSSGKMREALCATGAAEIVYENTWGDTFLGVCDGVGSNHLGKIIMQVRRELMDGPR